MATAASPVAASLNSTGTASPTTSSVPGVGTWALANSASSQPNKNNAQNAIYNPSTPIGDFLTGNAGPTTAYWATAQQTGNQYQNISNEGQAAYNQGYGLLDASMTGNLTGPQQMQLNTQLASIAQSKQSAIAQIQSSFAARGISDPNVQADAIAIASSVYSQQAQSAYTTVVQQGEQTGLSLMGIGQQQQESGAGGMAGLNQTMLSDISGTRQQTSESSGSFMDLVGGLVGAGAKIGGVVLGGSGGS